MSPPAPLRVGLVGAGPWAGMVHAPMLAASPAVSLVGIWARRPEAAAVLAERHSTRVFERYADLLEGCEAVAFAVAPDAQAELAVVAAGAGRHLLLEKPLALDLEAATALAEAAASAGVVSQLVLTQRYTPVIRRFLARAGAFRARGARCASVSGAVLDGGPFATPWRLAHGALLDIGPHVLDLLDAAVGTITGIEARGDPRRITAVICEHAGGAVSTATLSISQPLETPEWMCEVYGPDGAVTFDAAAQDMAAEFRAAQEAIPRELAEAVASGGRHPLDAARGLHLQRLIDAAGRSLRR